MPHVEENSVVLLSIVFKLVCGCGSTLWSTVVGGFVPHVFLGWVLNLGNAKNRYSQLVSILARHLKYSVWHWNTRKLTWYSSNTLWWIRTILKNLSCITSMITVQSTSKYFGAREQIAATTFKHMLTHLVQFLQHNEKKGIRQHTTRCLPLTTSPTSQTTRQ